MHVGSNDGRDFMGLANWQLNNANARTTIDRIEFFFLFLKTKCEQLNGFCAFSLCWVRGQMLCVLWEGFWHLIREIRVLSRLRKPFEEQKRSLTLPRCFQLAIAWPARTAALSSCLAKKKMPLVPELSQCKATSWPRNEPGSRKLEHMPFTHNGRWVSRNISFAH